MWGRLKMGTLEKINERDHRNNACFQAKAATEEALAEGLSAKEILDSTYPEDG